MEKIPVQRRLILNPNPEINILDKNWFLQIFSDGFSEKLSYAKSDQFNHPSSFIGEVFSQKW